MSKQDLFDQIADNLVVTNINDLITKRQAKLKDLVTPYYTQEDFDSWEYWMNSIFPLTYTPPEPKWPKGKTQELRAEYKRLEDEIYELNGLFKGILKYAKIDANSDDQVQYQWTLDSIKIRKTKET